MKPLFITGSAGFLGQHIVQAVCQAYPEASVRALVRRTRRLHIPIDSMPQVSLVHGNLDQPESYAEALRGAETVIHNAALVSFRRSDRSAILQANVGGTQELLRAAVGAGVRNFIFISSISAIGGQNGRPGSEDDYPDMAWKQRHDAYGYSKLLGEQECRRYAGRMRVVILNPSVIIGPGSELISRLLKLVRYAPLAPMLTTMNSFVDVRDAARAAALAVERGRSGERYIVTAWNASMLELTRQVLRLAGWRKPVLPVKNGWLRLGDAAIDLMDALRINPGMRRPSEMAVDKVYSSAKIQAQLGWQPQVDLEQSLKDTLQATMDSYR